MRKINERKWEILFTAEGQSVSASSSPLRAGARARSSARLRAAGLAALGLISWAAGSAHAQNITLFTTADDFSSWSNGDATTAASSTAYDFDGSTTNGAGGSGGTGTAGSLSLQLTSSTGLGYGSRIAYLPGEASNSAFMTAMDPGSIAAYSAASNYQAGTTVAYSGSLQVTYTLPTISSGSYFQLGMFFNYDNGYNNDFSSSTVNDGTVGGLSTYTSTIPYTIGAGNLNYLQMAIVTNSDYVPTATSSMYIDDLQVVNPVVFTAVNANWIYNGSGNWEASANWNPSIPGIVGSTATFDSDGGAITVNPTVSLSSPVTLDSINFNTSAVSYTIVNGGGGSITLDGSTGNQVNVFAGNHSISAPVVMSGGTTFTIDTGSTLTLANVTGGGYGTVAVTGGGTLIENQIATTGISLTVNGATLTTLSASTPPQEVYYFNVYNSAVLNLNGALVVDGGNFDSSATINLGASGQLLTQGSSTDNVNSTIAGSGSIGIGGGPNGGATTAYFNGTNSNYSGPVSVSNGSTVIIGTDANLGNGSATNTITLNNGTLETTAAFTGTHALIAASGGGTFNTSGFNVSLGSISGAGTLSVLGGGVVTIAPQTAGAGVRTLTLGGLNIAAGEVSLDTAALHSDKTVLVTGALTLAGATGMWTSALDLGGNDMIIQAAGPLGLTTTFNQIQQGYNGSTWQGGGGGITSSAAAADSRHLTALGVILNDNGSGAPLVITFDGAATADGDVLVKYTYYGDTNLDGKVDGTDYSRIDNAVLANAGHPGSATGWYNGDFNYDGVINGSDYTLIDNAFNTQGASLAAEFASPNAVATAQLAGPAGTASVPEPATLGLIIFGTAGLLGRRRRFC